MKIKSILYLGVLLLIILTTSVIFMALSPSKDVAWKNADDPARIRMIKKFEADRSLHGLSKAELIEKIGKPKEIFHDDIDGEKWFYGPYEGNFPSNIKGVVILRIYFKGTPPRVSAAFTES